VIRRAISIQGVSPSAARSRAVYPSTYPLPYEFVTDLGGVPEAHSLDGRMWSVVKGDVRKVILLEQDTGVVLDELPVRTTWYETREYEYWARGENWILFSNEVITHDGEHLTSRRLQDEWPLEEYRFMLTEGDPLAGRTGLFNQWIMKYDWLNTHTNPFPHHADSFVPPGFLRFSKAEGDYLFLGRFLLKLTDGAPLQHPYSSVAYQVVGTTYGVPNPENSSSLVHRPGYLLDEEQLQIIDGKLYGSAYRWCGRAYLFPMDFTADGSPAGTMWLLIGNSYDINDGAFTTSVGTETGRCAICDGPFGIKLAQGETTETGPWRHSEGAKTLELIDGAATERDYGEGTIMSARGGGSVIVEEDALWNIAVVPEDYVPEGEEETVKAGTMAVTEAARAVGAMKHWIAPTGEGGGVVCGMIAAETGDATIYTDGGGIFNRCAAPTNRGGTCLPRIVTGEETNWEVQESFAASPSGKLYRSRIIRRRAIEEPIPVTYPVWTDIVKQPVTLKILERKTGEAWDASCNAPLLYRTIDSAAPGNTIWSYSGIGPSISIQLLWIGADAETLTTDTFSYSGLEPGQHIVFPVAYAGWDIVTAQLWDEDSQLDEWEVPAPEGCYGMWRRASSSWDGKASGTVGIQCNFTYIAAERQTGNFIHAPYSILRKDIEGNVFLVDGAERIGHLNFFHATAGNDFQIYDDAFVDMVEDIELSAPTAETPNPPLYVPNGMSGAWMKQWGADPYTDAFSKERYRKCVCAITNRAGWNADAGGNRQWSASRLVVVSAILDTESLDLAAEAYKCKVNI